MIVTNARHTYSNNTFVDSTLDASASEKCARVRALFVNNCTLDWLQVSQACTAFTHLTQLAVMGNRIDAIADAPGRFNGRFGGKGGCVVERSQEHLAFGLGCKEEARCLIRSWMGKDCYDLDCGCNTFGCAKCSDMDDDSHSHDDDCDCDTCSLN